MSERMKVAFRIRINGRLPDPDGKYRDEITQEASVELSDCDPTGSFVDKVESEMKRVRARFYAELNRLGGYNYQEKT